MSPTTIGDWLRGEHFPQDIGKVLAMVQMVRAAADRRRVAIPGSGPTGLLDEDRWRTAHRQEAQRRAGVVSRGVEHAQAVWALAGPRKRVSEASLRLLGVHEAIRVPGVPDEVPPEYVPRDVDAAEFGIWAKVEAAAQRGGFVLLAGGSSVGKTRCAAEGVKALLPHWWLVHPAGPDQVAALAQAPPPQTVVWLDELQRYLDGEHGLTGPVVRALLTATPPVVIIGTLWPDRYNTYTAVPAPGAADPHARERQVLDLAAVIHIDPEFTSPEQDRARAAAARDPRLKIALDTTDYGLTQTLAAAPQLVARWQNAKTDAPYAWAVLTAALDAARLGARAPLNPGLLRAAAPGYCTSQQQAEAPDNWFEQALAYATEKLHGAAAALSPAGAGMGQIAGYTAADYLIQHASRERRSARVPASTWDAILTSVRDPDDAARLADSASNRLLYRYAIPLYHRAADAGVLGATRELAGLLGQRGDLEELRARADAGDRDAALELAGLLDRRGDLDEAVQILRARADAGDRDAALELAGLLDRRGDLDEAVQILRARADAGDHRAAVRLAILLDRHGDLDEAVQILRGKLEELRGWADVSQLSASWLLAILLAKRGDLEELRARADAGDGDATRWLAVMLADRGDLDEAIQFLRGRADAGHWEAALMLAKVLASRGDLDGAAQILRDQPHGGTMVAVGLADLLADHGDLDEAVQILRGQADDLFRTVTRKLTDLLARRGDLDEAVQILRGQADAGNRAAARELAGMLADLLIKQGQAEEAERLRRFGLNPDGSIASA